MFSICSTPAMTRKERIEYMKWKREREGPQLSMREQGLLGLLGKVRPFTYRADMGNDPLSLALQALHKNIDDIAEAVTGRRDYFWARHHSIGCRDSG